MKRLVISMVFLCLLISAAQVQAQTWSAAEKEVLQAVEDCYRAFKEENLEAALACFHDDYVGFGYGSPVTGSKADLRKSLPITWARLELVEFWYRPLAIRIVGNVAIVHSYYFDRYLDKDGEMKRSRERWTEIMVKQDGKWVWIADHGGEDPGVKPAGEQ